MDEFSFIEYLKRRVSRLSRVPLGIGDDAALLDFPKGKQLVVATDAVVENVDFYVRKTSPEKIGRKAFAINLSDMAAMGAKPTAFVITIGKPSWVAPAWLCQFYDGLLALAKQYGVACVGGDISRSREFFANVTIMGEVPVGQAVTRSGAVNGDWIAVTGKLGGSLLRHQFDFIPRLGEGEFLAKNRFATAMIDVSDGLAQDLGHILKASKAGALLDRESIPVSADALKMSRGNKEKAFARALSDGEDFELLFTVRPRRKKELERKWKKRFPRVPLAWIGRIEKVPGIRWRSKGRKISAPKLSQKGFKHF